MKADGNKIKSLMESKSLTIVSLAKKSGLDYKTVAALVKETKTPYPYTVGMVADALEVDVLEICKSANFIELEMARNLLMLSDLAKICDVDANTLRNVIQGKYKTTTKTAEAIARGLNVSVEKVLEAKNGK